MDLTWFIYLELGTWVKFCFLIFFGYWSFKVFCLLRTILPLSKCKWRIHLSKFYLLQLMFNTWFLKSVEYIMKLIFLINKIIFPCLYWNRSNHLNSIIMNSSINSTEKSLVSWVLSCFVISPIITAKMIRSSLYTVIFLFYINVYWLC